MTSYKIDRTLTNKKELKKKIKSDGYHMKPKLKTHDELIEVKEIIIVNPTLKEKALSMQFNIAFRKIFKIIMNIKESDATSTGDMKIALSEIERMKSILKDKYRQHLSQKEYRTMVKKVKLLEYELNMKIIKNEEKKESLMFQKMMEYPFEEERGRGR